MHGYPLILFKVNVIIEKILERKGKFMDNLDLKEYLEKEISKIVDILFKNLRFYNIDVNVEKESLDKLQLDNYNKIYTRYKQSLSTLQEKAILKYGYTNDFDNLFGIIIYNAINTMQNK